MGGRNVVLDDEDEMKDIEDEEDEDDEELDEYEKDGFIVDDVEEEGQKRRKKKKKREIEKNYELDEDDYELLQDNKVTELGSKFKRLKKAGLDPEMAGWSGFSNEGCDWNIHGGQSTAEEKLKRSLFGDDEGAPFEDMVEVEEQLEDEVDEDDEMADFIVDEEDTKEHGAVIKKKQLNKKKVRRAPGVSSSALQGAHEIFGDGDQFLMLRKQAIARAASDAGGFGEKRSEDEFEQFIFSENYTTLKDDAVRETDVPERIQLSEDITGHPPTDDDCIEEESLWIHNQLLAAADIPPHNLLLASGCIPLQIANMQVVKDKAIDKEDIRRFLTMIHKERFDLPFIAMYRMESCLSLLKDSEDISVGGDQAPRIMWHKLLWTVHNLDRKWLLLRKRKAALQKYYNKRFDVEAQRIDDETRLTLNQQIFDSINEMLKNSNTEREVDDVDAKFNLHFPPGEVEEEEGKFIRPKKKSFYSVCYKSGLWELANKFGYSSEQFGSYLTKEKMSLELEDAKETPEEVAANFTCAMFETPVDVLKGARHMAAVEIGCEPSVRKHVSGIFMNNAVVSTRPTPAGNLTIDAHHELAGVKWLRCKPLSKFVDAQWLCIQKGEEEKLLQVTIKLPDTVQNELLKDAKENYLSDNVRKSAQLWNEERKKILEDAYFNFILPSVEKVARAFLTSIAKSWLLMEYGSHLWSKVSVAPYKKKETNDDTEDESDLRVMACCWGPGRPATTFVMLSPAGELVDVLYAGSISVRSQGVAEQQRKQLDQQRLLKYMTKHQPHVVCLGTANLSCRSLKDDICEVIFKAVENQSGDFSQDTNVSVIFGDESLPCLYENSRPSSDQLPCQPGIVQRAVGLGRYLQNPLAMIATLCGPGKEILSWKICPLEHFLTDDEKYEMIEQVMIDATNQVGLDINLAASHMWHFAPLQFISGLGPRKASTLQRAYVRAGAIFDRKSIPMGILRKKVFINAVGFLRVRRSGAAAVTNQIMDLLDDTRIHPLSYDLARNMAKDVLREGLQHGTDEVDDDEQETEIEHVRDRPEVLNALDIDAYNESYVKENGTRKWETFYLIKMELLHGFQDWRVPFREPNPEEEFSMLSGETENSLSHGKLVQVTVRQVQDNRIMCLFDSGLKGFIMAEDFSDEGLEPEKVKVGEILTCKIKNVNKERILAYLTCKGSELSRKPRFIRDVDPYYQEDEVIPRSKQEKSQKEMEPAKKHFRPRMIIHPHFQNLASDEAMRFLSDKDIGESIIRPSSKGPSFLTLTLKVFDGVFAHKDIIEGGKDHKDMTSLLRLGRTLTIDKETFEDLNEIMDKYVDPLVRKLKNMLGFRKFKKGTSTEVDELLKVEKAENPTKIVYCFGISHEHPGTFILSYIRSSNPHHEYIGLYHKGFRFRKKDFEDIERLVAYFQNNIDMPPPTKSSGAWGSSGRKPDYRNNYDGDDIDDSTGGRGRGGRGRGRGRGRGSGRGRGRDSDFGSRNEDDGNGCGGAWGSSNDNNNNNNDGSGWGGGSGCGWVSGGDVGDDIDDSTGGRGRGRGGRGRGRGRGRGSGRGRDSDFGSRNEDDGNGSGGAWGSSNDNNNNNNNGSGWGGGSGCGWVSGGDVGGVSNWGGGNNNNNNKDDSGGARGHAGCWGGGSDSGFGNSGWSSGGSKKPASHSEGGGGWSTGEGVLGARPDSWNNYDGDDRDDNPSGPGRGGRGRGRGGRGRGHGRGRGRGGGRDSAFGSSIIEDGGGSGVWSSFNNDNRDDGGWGGGGGGGGDSSGWGGHLASNRGSGNLWGSGAHDDDSNNKKDDGGWLGGGGNNDRGRGSSGGGWGGSGAGNRGRGSSCARGANDDDNKKDDGGWGGGGGNNVGSGWGCGGGRGGGGGGWAGSAAGNRGGGSSWGSGANDDDNSKKNDGDWGGGGGGGGGNNDGGWGVGGGGGDSIGGRRGGSGAGNRGGGISWGSGANDDDKNKKDGGGWGGGGGRGSSGGGANRGGGISWDSGANDVDNKKKGDGGGWAGGSNKPVSQPVGDSGGGWGGGSDLAVGNSMWNGGDSKKQVTLSEDGTGWSGGGGGCGGGSDSGLGDSAWCGGGSKKLVNQSEDGGGWSASAAAGGCGGGGGSGGGGGGGSKKQVTQSEDGSGWSGGGGGW